MDLARVYVYQLGHFQIIVQTYIITVHGLGFCYYGNRRLLLFLCTIDWPSVKRPNMH